MKRKLMRTFGAMALSLLSNSSWAQEPGIRPQVAEPAVTIGELAQKDNRIEIAPVPNAVEGPHPVPVNGGPNAYPNAYPNGYQLDCNGCNNKPRDYFTAGVGVYVMQPNFETNPAFRLNSTPTPGNVVNTQKDFTYGAEIAPLAWVGWVCDCGLGVRLRWFNFDQDANESFTNDGTFTVTHASPLGVTGTFGSASGSVYNFSSNLRLDVWDLEATKDFSHGNWTVLLAGGVRYAHMSQDYLGSGPGAAGDTLTVASGHNFNGIGTTIALEAKRRVCDTGFAMYGNARGSVLFGTAKQTAASANTDAAGNVTGSTVNNAEQSDVLPIGEVEIGGEYGCDLGKCRLYVQAGFVGQVWWGGGNASNTAVFGTSDNSSNFGFVGGVLRLGVNF